MEELQRDAYVKSSSVDSKYAVYRVSIYVPISYSYTYIYIINNIAKNISHLRTYILAMQHTY